MTDPIPHRRPLGTMIVYGYPRAPLDGELAIARRIGADCLEILPDWRTYPDPTVLRDAAGVAGLAVHSVHGCWGGQSIRARQVDLGSLDPATRAESVADISRCIDWAHEAGGGFLVVHPGGLADAADTSRRRDALLTSLRTLAPLAETARVVVCVENMPPGVHPGSDMADLVPIVTEVGSSWVDLALDTGHAAITESAASIDLGHATRSAGKYLATTHVHDNNGRQDAHLPPGRGVVDWDGWLRHLDAIHYRGPIMLECIRYLRTHPECIDDVFLCRLRRLTGMDRS